MKEHLFIANDGDMFDTRNPVWSHNKPLRAGYRRTYSEIRTVANFKATLRNGAYAWPGGYPMYLITSDGAALCFDCAKKNARNIFDSIDRRSGDGWRVVACDINYEDTALFCDNCSDMIESAYGND